MLLGLAVLAPPATADPTAGARPGPGWWPDRSAVVSYEAPVSGAVLRGFDPPATALGPGHRGADLVAAPHATVRSSADGRVAFAGSVAGTSWVAIAHADGVTTSYGPLAGLRVRTGDDVSRASAIGTLASGGHGHLGLDAGLHWGARIDGRYIDPLELLDVGVPRPSLVGSGAWSGVAHAVVPYEPWSGGRFAGLLATASPTAERPGFAVPPNPNHLVLVPGLASSSGTEVLDPEHLGYDPRSVTRFSYAGRHDDGEGVAADPDPRRDQLPQHSSDTWAGTEQAAATLAAQLRAQALREPGRAVDLIGHSMGGSTILRYLVEHHDPYDRTLPPIGHVVTIAAPLDGSDLASLGRTVRDTPLAGTLVGRLQANGRLGGDDLPLDAPAIDELSVGSDALWELAVDWEQALHEGARGPLATGTRVLNVGGSRDLVVSSARTRQPDTTWHDGMPTDVSVGPSSDPFTSAPRGFLERNGRTAELEGERIVDHRVLPGGHETVLETEAIREVTWRFLADEEVVDSPAHLSRVVGGELADTTRIGGEVLSLYGSFGRPLRRPSRAIPLVPG